MNDSDRSELERLTQRQHLLQDRLASWEAAIQGEMNRLRTARQELEDLRGQGLRWRDEHRQVEAQLGALQRRLMPAPPSHEPHPLTPSLSPSRGEGARRAGEGDAVAPHIPAERPAPAQPPPLPPWVQPPPPPASPLAAPATAVPSAELEEPPLVTNQVREEPPPESRGSFELRLGTYWLVRLGVVVLLTGMVFLANFAYKNYVGRLGPGGKVAVLYLVSFGLLGLGTWLHRKQASLRNYARVLVAGGLAAVYFTTYAAHHVANLRVIGSATLDGALLLAWAALIVWLADRLKSEVLALFATGLGYYTAVITSVGAFTLYSNAVLTAAAVFFLVRNRWALLSRISLAATYLAYAFWRFFHDGDWRWATPEEGLWQGLYFLMGYWTLFTAATFLSRDERWTGRSRALFATLNNGAFFALFLLTMFQVRTGGFWKFSFYYGAALLVAAALAGRWLAGERTTGQAYLTQGLLLVTFGAVIRFSGLNLALLLAIESVGLLVLGRLLGQPIMRWGAFITAAMALAWAGLGLQAFDRRGLITGSVLGAFMLFNAQWDRRRKEDADRELPVGMVLFTAAAVFIWAFTTWRNVDVPWVAVAWAAESVVALFASQPLSNRALRFGAFPLAVLATGAAGLNLLDQTRLDMAVRTGGWAAALAGGLIVFNAWWARREVKFGAAEGFAPASSVFAALGLLVWLEATWVFTPPQSLAITLAAEAAALAVAGWGAGLIEVTVLAQAYLVIAQLHCLAHMVPASSLGGLPWWNPAGVLAITLGFSHGWQRGHVPARLAKARDACQAAYALAAVLVLMFWLKPYFGPAFWMALTCLLALGVTAYAALTRVWALAVTGQILLVASLFEFGRQILFAEGPAPAWPFALAPIAAFIGFPWLVALWRARNPAADARAGKPLAMASLLYRSVGGLLALAWIFEYVPARDRFWALVLVGGGLGFWAGLRRSSEAAWAGGVFSVAGFMVFWNDADSGRIVYVPNLLAILFVMAQQQVARRQAARFNLSESAHNAAMVISGCSLGLLVSRWVLLQAGGFYLTAAWAALALVIFTTGFLLRERMYRWLGLGVLGLSLGRVVFFDVWGLETLQRILSFMALGAVLLVLGFLYNRYQERIRQWL